MHALSDYDLPTLSAQLARDGHKPSQADKLLMEFYKCAGRLDATPLQLGKTLTAQLHAVDLRQSQILSHSRSIDGTVKFLIGLSRGGQVESVLMPSYRPDRAAGCVSSQIGCAMGCDFCASTRDGLQRNLEAGEIVEQFLHLKEQAALLNRRLVSLVFMGMGEPMHNLENVVPAIRRIIHPRLGALGGRHITVSTVGIVPGIDQLADAGLNVHLAVSLHAPDDATRCRLVPTARRWSVREILDATRRFQQRTRRVPTIEYCMLDGVNDSDEQAVALADVLGDLRAHVNLIPYNPIGVGLSGAVYRRPPRERLIAFLTILRDRGIVAHLRDTRGDDVNAACGQLRQNHLAAGLARRES